MTSDHLSSLSGAELFAMLREDCVLAGGLPVPADVEYVSMSRDRTGQASFVVKTPDGQLLTVVLAPPKQNG